MVPHATSHLGAKPTAVTLSSSLSDDEEDQVLAAVSKDHSFSSLSREAETKCRSSWVQARDLGKSAKSSTTGFHPYQIMRSCASMLECS